MNAIVGERLSIITSKAQTTRHRILGMVNGDDYQMVFSDTPGVIQPAYAMQERMMKFVKTAFEDADIILYLVEPGDKGLKVEGLFERIKEIDIPVFLIINKIDDSDQESVESEIDHWKTTLPKAQIRCISALHGMGVKEIKEELIQALPDSPPFFDKESLTDRPERFFVSETIREKVLLNYKKEVPYSVEVEVESFKHEEELLRIRAIIYVARESQKGILIGHKGQALTRVGSQARADLEAFFNKKIFLELYVKVAKDWRDSDQQLKRFGYES